ncbi:MAG: protein BatD [Candidatus Hydrogenedentota bacterium]|nr:MAG: protein BatD [Candidatus Hydrogenedentota bacterium]
MATAVVLIMGLLPGALRADAGVRLTANVSSTHVRVGEPFRYTVTVFSSSGSVPQPQLGALTGVDVVGRSTSQSFSFVNGSLSASSSTHYTLVARRPGTLTIPPATITVGGTLIQSNPVTVTVDTAAPTPPSPSGSGAAQAPPASGANPPAHRSSASRPDIWLELEPEKRTVFVGEALPVNIRLYSNTALAGYGLEPMTPSGFWIEEAELPKKPEVEQKTVRGQRVYSVLVRRLILFPTKPGRLTIPSQKGTIQYYVRKRQRDPFEEFFRHPFFNDPFFRDPFFDRSVLVVEETEARSKPLAITVKSLPRSRFRRNHVPVGRFTIAARLKKRTLAVNEGTTLTVTIQGRGTLQGSNIDTPPEVPGCNVFPSQTRRSFEADRNSYRGTLVAEYAVVGLAEGRYTVPPIPFTFFDPERKRYVTISSESLPFVVEGTASAAPIPGVTAQGPATPVNRITGEQKDLIDIHTEYRPRRRRRPLSSTQKILLNLLPWTLVLLSALDRRRRILLRDPAYAARVRAPARVRAALSDAVKALSSPEVSEFYRLLYLAIAEEIAAKFSVPAPSVQPERVSAILQGAVPEEKIRTIRDFLEICHRRRYSPETPERAEKKRDLETARNLVKTLGRIKVRNR